MRLRVQLEKLDKSKCVDDEALDVCASQQQSFIVSRFALDSLILIALTNG